MLQPRVVLQPFSYNCWIRLLGLCILHCSVRLGCNVQQAEANPNLNARDAMQRAHFDVDSVAHASYKCRFGTIVERFPHMHIFSQGLG